MFGRLTDVVNNIKNIQEGQIQILVWSDKKVQEYIIRLITIEQLFKKGEDSEGVLLGTYGSFTELVNEGRTFSVGGESAKKLFGEHYTLYDTGAFYKSYGILPKKDGFVVLADGVKEDGTDLVGEYGINILNLSNKNKDELASFIVPFIIKDLRRQIFK